MPRPTPFAQTDPLCPMQTANRLHTLARQWARLLSCALFSAPFWIQAQPVYPYNHPQQAGAADLREQLERLRVLGSALFVAAHPDDENTRLIAWLAGERKVTTTYLSLTRGDGGQNLIGPEMSELLGVLRTQELLRARGVDRGEQMFTRANDFGYSKHPDETLAIWDRDEVLGDLVWSIRKTRPDIIVNRFNHRTPGTTHGHHTASAVLALEAFTLAADPKAYPEQLTEVEPWQASRIFFNTSWWFYGSQEAFQKADKSGLIAVDPGTYNPLRGLSYTEVAARSRSMHRCQGFGSTGSRGSDLDYLEFLDGVPMPMPMPVPGQVLGAASAGGDLPASQTVPQGDPFAGLDISWLRLNGGSAVNEALRRASEAFRPEKPEAAVPALLEAWKLMQPLESDPRVAKKRSETAELIRQCLGLWAEAVANEPLASPGDSVRIQLEVVQRSAAAFSLESIQLMDASARALEQVEKLPQPLAANVGWKTSMVLKLPDDLAFSTAYWLQEPGTLGLFQVTDQTLRGQSESPRPLTVTAVIKVAGTLLPLRFPVVYKENDPERGEVYQAFELVPPAVIAAERPVFLFSGNGPESVRVSVRANRDQVGGRVIVRWPEGWSASGDPSFQLAKKGQEKVLEFQVVPPPGNQTADLFLALEIDGKRYPFSQETVAYEHIPTQTLLRPAMTRLAKLDLAIESRNIGYIMGAGDEIPAALRDIGCTVTLLEDADLRPEGLAERLGRFDAVVAGVRAYNTRDALLGAQEGLMQFVENGGTYLVQYNINRGLVSENLGPYPIALGRGRVTEEEAAVQLLAADHPALSSPNSLSSSDFQGWVQERGLYFAETWDASYTPLLAAQDGGEDLLSGGLLVAPYGKGWYVYTGYSFFRQLPNGVPGAFRLFANLLSLGH